MNVSEALDEATRLQPNCLAISVVTPKTRPWVEAEVRVIFKGYPTVTYDLIDGFLWYRGTERVRVGV